MLNLKAMFSYEEEDSTTRLLASIRTIGSLEGIQGKDVIVKATVDGWNTIVKKDEFKEGDLCIFFEIDSFLPASDQRFSFLTKGRVTYKGTEGFRLRTMKMAGVTSQGLALPISYFPEVTSRKLGNDVTKLLNVIKYDNQQASANNGAKVITGDTKGKFPRFIPKTDQTRIQNLTKYFQEHLNTSFEETLKLDGSSMTVYKVKKELTMFKRLLKLLGFKPNETYFGVCSRNLELKKYAKHSAVFNNNGKESTFVTSDFWSTAIDLNLEAKLPAGYAIQGELIGPKIKANHEKVTKLEFYVFDVYDIENKRFLTPAERKAFTSINGIPHIPIVSSSIKIFEECKTMEELLARVEGVSMNKGTVSEGRVYKSEDGKVTFKAISNKYLLKYEE